jgi:hypothetical protein
VVQEGRVLGSTRRTLIRPTEPAALEVMTDSTQFARPVGHGHEEDAMQLELNDEEFAALRRVLDASLRELKGEIHDTDNVSFRKELSSHQATLQAICARLDG